MLLFGNTNFAFLICTFTLVYLFKGAQFQIQTKLKNAAGAITDDTGNVLTKISANEQSPTTRAMCDLTTDGLIRYYNFKPQIHYVKTDDGYILKVFRCNPISDVLPTKVLIMMHGNLFLIFLK